VGEGESNGNWTHLNVPLQRFAWDAEARRSRGEELFGSWANVISSANRSPMNN
jgi:hypothetical protein